MPVFFRSTCSLCSTKEICKLSKGHMTHGILSYSNNLEIPVPQKMNSRYLIRLQSGALLRALPYFGKILFRKRRTTLLNLSSLSRMGNGDCGDLTIFAILHEGLSQQGMFSN
ncbi:hypothetical protein CEXT_563881 [Caerostris extrusa]|uniref:Uncharacterized protein n=1 Tax=Caerostris extrusa TaxID=172846 RepID=A0AAV4XGP2_CAEEX|nr:hypothetical protein CEXT_563881 [Caerostris extrusa]